MSTFNKKAKFEYKLEPDRIEAGLVLSGGEAKAIRTGHADISTAVCRILNDEVYLINANIPVQGATKYVPTRSRKLLLHRDEIVSIRTRAKQRKLTLVPVKLYTKGRLVKLELALGTPKHKFEKRALIKAKDIERDIAQELKGRI
jgi:SsrA-binding protein